MRLGKFEHLEPKSLLEACTILNESPASARVISGGTDILLRMKQKLIAPQFLVDLKKIQGIGDIRFEAGEIRIGALVSLTDVQKSAVVRQQIPILAQAAGLVGAIQLQNMGTIGGNLCLDTRCWYYNQSYVWRQARAACFKTGGEVCHMAKGSQRCYALYCGDTAPALLALGAKVRLVSLRGERIVSLRDFFVDDGKNPTLLQADEVLTEVLVPVPEEGQRGTYLKFRRREAIDFPIVGVGASVTRENGVCQQACLALTGVSSSPVIIKNIDAILLGKKMTEELAGEAAQAAYTEVKPVSQMEVSPSYRKRLVRVLVKDALSQLFSLSV